MLDFDQDAVGGIIERVAQREGLELVHWEAAGTRNNLVLRVYIDKPGGVTHGDCEVVSKQLGLLLDVEDPIPGSYTLEVSSPGIERGLYKPDDYRRFAGNKVRVKTSEPIEGRRSFRGRLVGMENDVVILEAGTAGALEIPFQKITKANIEYEFK